MILNRHTPRQIVGQIALAAALLLPSAISRPALADPSQTVSAPAASAVTVERRDGHWVFVQQGHPLPLRAVATGDHPWPLTALPALGATVVRTYRESDQWVLDAAQALGLKVIMGLWMEHPRHGFSYQSAADVAQQDQRILEFVRRYRQHPALLAWGVGNEVETGEPSAEAVWRQVDRLAEKIKALDPHHPTVMVVGDGDSAYLKPLATCCQHVDVVGVNAYGGSVFSLAERLTAAGITKPAMISELGPLGHWQAGQMPWGAPVELTSRQKAAFFQDSLTRLSQSSGPLMGGVAFLWGAKQERTATWYSLLSDDGTLTEAVDGLARGWGTTPVAASPSISGLGLSAATFAPSAAVSAGVVLENAQHASLSGQVIPESRESKKGGDYEPPLPPLPLTVQVQRSPARDSAPENALLTFTAPAQTGAYRLFITLRTSDRVATANLPFLVTTSP